MAHDDCGQTDGRKEFTKYPTKLWHGMNVSAFLSIAAAGTSLALSVWLFVASGQNQKLQGELQKKQQELQAEQQEVQLQTQQLQAQQDQINAGIRLAQEVGPAVLRDVGNLSVQNKNESLKMLLAKYGVTIEEKAPEADAKSKPANP